MNCLFNVLAHYKLTVAAASVSLGRDFTCLRNCTRGTNLVPNLTYMFNWLRSGDCDGHGI